MSIAVAAALSVPERHFCFGRADVVHAVSCRIFMLLNSMPTLLIGAWILRVGFVIERLWLCKRWALQCDWGVCLLVAL